MLPTDPDYSLRNDLPYRLSYLSSIIGLVAVFALSTRWAYAVLATHVTVTVALAWWCLRRQYRKEAAARAARKAVAL
jgi:hypothetical protein